MTPDRRARGPRGGASPRELQATQDAMRADLGLLPAGTVYNHMGDPVPPPLADHGPAADRIRGEHAAAIAARVPRQRKETPMADPVIAGGTAYKHTPCCDVEIVIDWTESTERVFTAAEPAGDPDVGVTVWRTADALEFDCPRRACSTPLVYRIRDAELVEV